LQEVRRNRERDMEKKFHDHKAPVMKSGLSTQKMMFILLMGLLVVLGISTYYH
jgi:hypothetical protein